MKVLSVDTSTKFISIAIKNGDELILSFDRFLYRRHSSDLLPTIDEALRLSELSLDMIDGFAIGLGPGSFTGLRIGITTMKGLVFTTRKPIIGISSLDAIAYNVIGSSQLICPIIDAKRNQVYSAIYKGEAEKIKRISRYFVLPVDKLIKKINGQVLFLGDGIEIYKDKITHAMKHKAKFAPKFTWFPKADIIAELARKKLESGKSDDVLKMVPMYLYPSTVQVMRK